MGEKKFMREEKLKSMPSVGGKRRTPVASLVGIPDRAWKGGKSTYRLQTNKRDLGGFPCCWKKKKSGRKRSGLNVGERRRGRIKKKPKIQVKKNDVRAS